MNFRDLFSNSARNTFAAAVAIAGAAGFNIIAQKDSAPETPPAVMSITAVLNAADKQELSRVTIGEQLVTAETRDGTKMQSAIPPGMNAFDEFTARGVEIWGDDSSWMENIPVINEQQFAEKPLYPLLTGAALGIGMLGLPLLRTAWDNTRARFQKRSPEDLKITAYHEAGHALLGILCPEFSQINKASIVPNAVTTGCVYFKPSKSFMSKAAFWDDLTITCGGRAAQEIVFGTDKGKDAGATGDMNYITSTAKNMVYRWGMAEGLPEIDYEELEEKGLLTEATKQKLNDAVEKLCTAAKNRAYKLLTQHRDKLDILAQAFLERKTLKAEEIYKIVGMRPGDYKPAEAVITLAPEAP